tara:strand:+ start:1719 stop:2204 length:486 start_codon:yes stop_codon:yes gene_type:complete
MAETLGSLVDKLSIKNLRVWHIQEELDSRGSNSKLVDELNAKKKLAEKQRDELMEEINGFFALALKGEVKVRDQKLKLYKNLNVSSLDGLDKLGAVISELSIRNIRLWHLEDEVRRKDIPDAQVASCKRQIDTQNQERNDLMDKVDQILEDGTRNKKPNSD